VNYIWDLMIKAQDNGIEPQQIHFRPARNYSPYMELSLYDLNATTVDTYVELNPYYRFEQLFGSWFHPDLEEDEEFRHALFDIIVHFLAQMDMYQGMTRREYHIRFILRDIEEGVFGEAAVHQLALLSREEREQLGEQLLRLYETGEPLALLRRTLRDWFPRSLIYVNREEKEELMIYIGKQDTPPNRAKVELLLTLFLPVHFEVRLYWTHHFGLIGTGETMIMDRIAMY